MIDPEAETRAMQAEVAKAEALVARDRGKIFWVTAIPLAVGAALGLYLAGRESWWGLVVLWVGILLTWPVNSFMVKRWWTWASRQDVDINLLRDAAEDAKLIWRRNTFFGRREEATWLRLSGRKPPL